MTRHLLYIGCGGFVGAILRFLISGWIQRITKSAFFPWGTLGVNLTGCFLIGLLGGRADHHELFSPETRIFLLIGVLGSFTTFSTFSYETLALIRDQQIVSVLFNIFAHVGFGLAAAWVGYSISQYS